MRIQWFDKLLPIVFAAFSSAAMAQVNNTDNSTEGNWGTGASNDLAAPELTPPSPDSNASNVNQAFISQASNTDVAYITQTGVGNYAAIYQANRSGHVAIITQTGNNGYAVIRQN